MLYLIRKLKKKLFNYLKKNIWDQLYYLYYDKSKKKYIVKSKYKFFNLIKKKGDIVSKLSIQTYLYEYNKKRKIIHKHKIIFQINFDPLLKFYLIKLIYPIINNFVNHIKGKNIKISIVLKYYYLDVEDFVNQFEVIKTSDPIFYIDDKLKLYNYLIRWLDNLNKEDSNDNLNNIKISCFEIHLFYYENDTKSINETLNF